MSDKELTIKKLEEEKKELTDQLELYEFVRDMPYGLVIDLKFLLEVDSPFELFKEI